jgi:malate permease and related proteins
MKTDALTNQVLILFLLIFVGFIARKKNLLNNEITAGLTNLLLTIIVPFTIITSFNLKFSPSILHNAIILFWCAVLAHVFSALLSLVLFFKYHGPDRKILKFATIFSNTGFMGLPVLGSLFGPMGIFYGSIYVATFNIFVWTLGVMIFTGKEELKILKALTNPSLIAVLLGFLLFFFSIQLPIPIYQTLDMIGGMNTPLSMIVIGSMLAGIKLKELFAGLPVYYGSTVRLLIVPLAVAFLLKLLGIQEHLLKICIVSTAMPVATMTAIFAEKYNGNTLLASRLIFISTALSLLTIPLILLLV